jgi:hypothetical protein
MLADDDDDDDDDDDGGGGDGSIDTHADGPRVRLAALAARTKSPMHTRMVPDSKPPHRERERERDRGRETERQRERQRDREAERAERQARLSRMSQRRRETLLCKLVGELTA